MRFDIYFRIGTPEIGILAHNNAISIACIFEEGRIRGTQLKIITNDRYIMPFAAEYGYDCGRDVFVREEPHASGSGSSWLSRSSGPRTTRSPSGTVLPWDSTVRISSGWS